MSSARERVAKNLRKIRKEQGLSQEKLAELAVLHRTYIGLLEHCHRNVSLDALEHISQALHVDIAELFNR